MIMSDAAWKIAQDHGGIWGEHPTVTRDNWKYEVKKNITQTGYWEYVMKQLNKVSHAQISN